MTSGITLSASVRNNLLSLQGTAKMMSETQNRLATGNKVNSAVDNATSFFTAAGLTNRANDLSGLQDDMGLAVKTVKAASTGIDGISKLVTQAKSIVNQAKQITGEATTGKATTTVTIASAGQKLVGSAGTLTFAASAVLSIDVSGVSSTLVTASAGTSVQDVLDAVNAIDGLSATLTSGKIEISDAQGREVSFKDAAKKITSTADLALTGGKTAAADKIEKQADFVTQYNDLRNQIDQLASDSSFNGVNLLNGQNLTVNFNATGTSSLALKGVDMTAGGSKLSLAEVDATTLTDGTAASALSSATTALRTQSSTFGSNLAVIQNRQDFTQATIDNLGAGAGDLTLADTNQEGANLLALQTRQSLATTALSLSNQAQSSILSILR